jgi:hypothetical protein
MFLMVGAVLFHRKYSLCIYQSEFDDDRNTLLLGDAGDDDDMVIFSKVRRPYISKTAWFRCFFSDVAHFSWAGERGAAPTRE